MALGDLVWVNLVVFGDSGGLAPQSPEVCATGKSDEFWVKNGLKLPKMQKLYFKMFGSNATFFFEFCLLQADNTQKFCSESNSLLKFCLSELTVTV